MNCECPALIFCCTLSTRPKKGLDKLINSLPIFQGYAHMWKKDPTAKAVLLKNCKKMAGSIFGDVRNNLMADLRGPLEHGQAPLTLRNLLRKMQIKGGLMVEADNINGDGRAAFQLPYKAYLAVLVSDEIIQHTTFRKQS